MYSHTVIGGNQFW